MPTWTSEALATAVVTTLQDVLVHQRARWASLFAQQHQYEGWWKAEFALALESWCWRNDLPEPTWVRSEVKPRDYGVGTSSESVDLLVARWSGETGDMVNEPPRVWVELKERGTWWGNPDKAMGMANAGVRKDIEKWRAAPWVPGDVVLACQIVAHDSTDGVYCHLPEPWLRVLDGIAAEFPRFVPTRSVCCPVANHAGTAVINRYASIDFFTIFGP